MLELLILKTRSLKLKALKPTKTLKRDLRHLIANLPENKKRDIVSCITALVEWRAINPFLRYVSKLNYQMYMVHQAELIEFYVMEVVQRRKYVQ